MHGTPDSTGLALEVAPCIYNNIAQIAMISTTEGHAVPDGYLLFFAKEEGKTYC